MAPRNRNSSITETVNAGRNTAATRFQGKGLFQVYIQNWVATNTSAAVTAAAKRRPAVTSRHQRGLRLNPMSRKRSRPIERITRGNSRNAEIRMERAK